MRSSISAVQKAPRGVALRFAPARVLGVFVAAALLSAAAGEVRAATLTGALSIDATDARLLAADCSNAGGGEPASMTVQVRDLAPVSGPIVSVQVRKGFAAKTSSDAIDGDAGASPLVLIDGGAGRYDLYVDKNAAGDESFEVIAQCWTGAGGTGSPAGTSLFAATGGAVPMSSPLAALALGVALVATGIVLRAGLNRGHGTGVSAGIAVGLALTMASEARAHEQAGSLGAAASATDYHEVTCFDNGAGQPGSVEISIRDASPGALPTVSAQVHRGSSLINVSDLLVADVAPSPSVFVSEGGGVYVVLVDKSGAGAKFYELSYHCWTGPGGTGVHTGSSLSTRQNE